MNKDDVVMVPLTMDQCAVITASLLLSAKSCRDGSEMYNKSIDAIMAVAEGVSDYEKGIS